MRIHGTEVRPHAAALHPAPADPGSVDAGDAGEHHRHHEEQQRVHGADRQHDPHLVANAESKCHADQERKIEGGHEAMHPSRQVERAQQRSRRGGRGCFVGDRPDHRLVVEHELVGKRT